LREGPKERHIPLLKTTVDSVLKPQKQITIRATGEALKRSSGDLPPDALLTPVGAGGSVEIFGFSDTESITWEKFLEKISNSNYRDSWREAIRSVMMSSFPDHINVDNSQIIVSSDGSKAYRLILTTVTRYYNDIYDFNIYFVEALQRADFGDAATTLLLRSRTGLQVSLHVSRGHEPILQRSDSGEGYPEAARNRKQSAERA
jgi:hypothetical protein